MSAHNILRGHASLTPGYYRLTPLDVAIIFVDIDDVRRGCMLHANGVYYLHLRTTLHNGEIRSAETSGPVGQLKISRISAALFWLKSIQAISSGHGMRRFGPEERLLLLTRDKADMAEAAFENVEFRHLRQYGLDDVTVQRNGWSWVENAWPLKEITKHASIDMVTSGQTVSCVYVHMHYWETWPEIESVLLNDCQGLDLIITSTEERTVEFERIRTRFLNCKIIVTENRGRDVGPFLELLRRGVFDAYDSVCKIHGKLSKKEDRETLSGTRIRRYILACLLADGACGRMLDLFIADQKSGIAGPANLLLPTDGEPVKRYIKSEMKQMRRVLARAHKAFHPEDVEFFAGTMFWFRPAAFEHLKHLNISISEFQPENGSKYNTLQHAMERLFCLFAKEAGFKILKLQPMISNGHTTDQGIA
jgi:hypothetical protein